MLDLKNNKFLTTEEIKEKANSRFKKSLEIRKRYEKMGVHGRSGPEGPIKSGLLKR